jgi:NAD(P)H-hydrate epimerase
VLARYLKNNGYDVRLVFPLGEPQTATAKEHLHFYQAWGYEVETFTRDSKVDWIVDGLLGVGSRLPLRNNLASIVDWINGQDSRIISIDVPTGVSSDDGKVDDHAVQADYTFSLHGYKPSAFLFPSSTYYGKVTAVDIGIPQTGRWRVWSEQDVKETLPQQAGNTHKGTFGTALLVAGSDEMPGSAALAAIGALRFGVGKLSISTTRHAASIIGPLVPEATYLYDLQMNDLQNRYSCLGIGPGLVPNNELEKTIAAILEIPFPVVLDAGAIGNRKYGTRLHPTILTPHPGEFSRLIGKTSKEIQENRMQYASEYAKENGVVVILKGQYTVIAFPNGTGFVNVTGNRALSKGGTGDTLTGMLLAGVCTHEKVEEAVANAVYLHGACADLWTSRYGEQTMTAHDFAKMLPEVCGQYT